MSSTSSTLDAPPATGLRLSRTADDYQRLALTALAPPRSGDIWAWCEKHLRMRDGSRWQSRRARLLKRWYRVAQARLSLTPDPADPWAHRCEQIWGVGGAQIAKSTWLHSILLSAMALYPRLMAFYRSRVQDLEEDMKTKLRPQLEMTRPLSDLLPRTTEGRRSALAAGTWTVGVSSLLFKCGNVADDWRAITPELMALDEFARYAADVEGTGDPIDSGIVRQITLPRTRLMLGSTSPTTIANHGWRRLCDNSASHERLLVQCPECGGLWDLVDARVGLSGGHELTAVPPTDIEKHGLARYVCHHNGCMITEPQLARALSDAIDLDRWCPGTWAMDKANPAGTWTPHPDALDTHGRLRGSRLPPAETEVRSWWASSLYAEHLSLNGYAKLLARGLQGTIANRQAHTNNHAAEPFIIRADANPLDVQAIAAAATPAKAYLWGSCPVPIKWLIGFQDQQGNTVEASWYPWTVIGFDEYGHGFVVCGGKATSDAEMDKVEQRSFEIAGQPRQVDLWVRDSGNGNLKFQHYMWAAAQPSRRVLFYGQPRLPAGIPWREEVDTPNTRRRTPKPVGVREWAVAPHHWRTETWARLTGKKPGTRIFLPTDAPKYFLESLTSEEQIEELRRTPGGHVQVVVWRPRVINTTAEKSTFRDDTHWWDGVNGCVEADDILRHLETPTAVTYGVVGTIG